MEEMMIIQAIDNYLQTRPRAERARRCFHPSSLHKSPREMYHHYLQGDAHQEFEPRILRIFDNGHAVHNRLQRYLQEIGLLRETEVSVENEEYEIKGHADGIMEINGVDGVLEIKSMNANQFYGSYEPKTEHLIQINVYMFCLGIPRACLLYECKDTQELKEFYIKQEQSILEEVLAKISYVQRWIRTGKEPDKLGDG
jgi:hypothetical protein